MKNEIWKDIPEYENMYKISNLGRVKSIERKVKNKHGFRIVKGNMLCNHLGDTGYLQVNLSKKSKTNYKRIHQLMAITFLGHTPDGFKKVVDHKDNIKTNNELSNLQIITNRENSSKDRKRGSSKYIGVYFNKNSKKWISRIMINGLRKQLGSFDSELDAHNIYQEELRVLQE